MNWSLKKLGIHISDTETDFSVIGSFSRIGQHVIVFDDLLLTCYSLKFPRNEQNTQVGTLMSATDSAVTFMGHQPWHITWKPQRQAVFGSEFLARRCATTKDEPTMREFLACNGKAYYS